MKQVIALIALGSLSILTSGCTQHSGEMENTSICKELCYLEDSLQPVDSLLVETMSPSSADTMFVIGYPEQHVWANGQENTVFTLGKLTYDGGNSGSSFREYDPMSESWRTTTTSPTPASLSVEKGELNYAIMERLPILKYRNWIFRKKPHLYFHAASLSHSQIAYNGHKLRVLKLVPDPSVCDHSVISPPTLPEHLADLGGSIIFIARQGYWLDKPFAPIPTSLSLELDPQNTRKLYEKLLRGEDSSSLQISTSDLKRVVNWLSAYPAFQEAKILLSGDNTPSFISLDRENIIDLKRERKALSLLKEAAILDPEWAAVGNTSVVAEDRIKVTERRPAGHAPDMGQRFYIGVGGKMFPNSYLNDISDHVIESSVILCVFGLYQVSQNVSMDIGNEFLDGYPDLVSSVDMEVDLGQVFMHVNYQTPLRIQLENDGKRLQISGGIVRLNKTIVNDSGSFVGDGLGYEASLSLVSRRNFYYCGPESKRFNRAGGIEIGYRFGEIAKFTAIIDGSKAMLLGSNGKTIRFRPGGWWVAYTLDFRGF